MIQLGDKVKDKISGMQGIATGRCHYLTGCTQFLVTPQETKDHKNVSSSWFDETRLFIVEVEAIAAETVSDEERPAGPQQDAPNPDNRSL